MVGRAVPSAPQSQQNAISLDGDFGGLGTDRPTGDGVLVLSPGAYRLTWDADADIAADADFERVSMSVKVEEK